MSDARHTLGSVNVQPSAFEAVPLWEFELRKGRSPHPSSGACLLDAVSWFTLGRLGDNPTSVCPVIANFARGVNDLLPDGPRQMLRQYIPQLPGTAVISELSRWMQGPVMEGRADACVRFVLRHAVLPGIMKRDGMGHLEMRSLGEALMCDDLPRFMALLKSYLIARTPFHPGLTVATYCYGGQRSARFKSAQPSGGDVLSLAHAMVSLMWEGALDAAATVAVAVIHAAGLEGPHGSDPYMMLGCLDEMLAVGPRVRAPEPYRMEHAMARFRELAALPPPGAKPVPGVFGFQAEVLLIDDAKLAYMQDLCFAEALKAPPIPPSPGKPPALYWGGPHAPAVDYAVDLMKPPVAWDGSWKPPKSFGLEFMPLGKKASSISLEYAF